MKAAVQKVEKELLKSIVRPVKCIRRKEERRPLARISKDKSSMMQKTRISAT